MRLFWFLPTHGDGHYLGTARGARQVSFSYLRQITQAVDDLGFEGVLIPTGRSCEDPWVVASALVSSTRRLKFLVAVRPGVTSPTSAARVTSTLDRISEGRLLINLVAGGDPEESEGDGVFLRHDQRYELADEFLQVWKRLLAGEKVTFEGRHVRVKGARVLFPPVQAPHPPVFIGGSSPAGHALAASGVDTYLSWGEPPSAVAEKITDVSRRAALLGRRIRYGIRLHVIVRRTTEEAWAAANDLLRYLDDQTIAKAQESFARFDSEGQRRMAGLHQGRRDKLEVSPNLWAGVGLVRGGAGTALVGDPETVAARIKEYQALGIETFILSGYPHLEEAYRTAELLFPHLPVSQASHPSQASVTGPFGEIVANEHLAQAAQS